MRSTKTSHLLSTLPASRKTALLGLFSALALALSFLESFLPALPVPGAKLGLSNVVTMYALYSLGLPAALTVATAKGVFALLRGGVASLMSLAGGWLSTLLMALILPLRGRLLSFVGVGVVGAVGHNTAQLMVAMLLVDPSLLYYAPWILLMALAAGILTGLTLNILIPALARFSPRMN